DSGLIDLAAQIARDWGLSLALVAVAEGQGDLADAQTAIDAARAQASVGGLKVRAEVRRGRVPEALREALHAAGADLMLLGRRGGGAGHAWAGGTVQKTLGLVECPVWVRA
ncbi:MAG: hypothetical protein F9K47_15930, partial [Burkholderiales bacterium]